MLDEIFSRLDELLQPQPVQIAVAVSGGADSFALLHMAQRWAQPKNIIVNALTVDHRLRPESTAEAHIVATWCAENNIPHRVLAWDGEKPVTALQANARQARRRILCQACSDADIEFLLLGHQADDQAETMVMRLQRGTGLGGLKAMQPLSHDKNTDVALVRPLLHIRREDLRKYCTENNLPFIDDPSNEKREFERVRVRQALHALPELADGIHKTSQRLKRADDTLNRMAQIWFDTHAQLPDPKKIWLPDLLQHELLPELQLRVLDLALRSITAQDTTLSQGETLAHQINNPEFSGTTIAGCWVRPKVMNRKQGFLFQPEPPRN